ncbi:MAG: hypothetical protein HS132_04895 [Planctomycetia bacterium]|nr:hypothetical protein [Planctomycetia bacterium]
MHELCKMLTITEVAKHFGMNWKTVKAIDKFSGTTIRAD